MNANDGGDDGDVGCDGGSDDGDDRYDGGDDSDVGGDDGDVGDLELLGDDARFRLHCISSCGVAALLLGKTAMSRSPP